MKCIAILICFFSMTFASTYYSHARTPEPSTGGGQATATNIHVSPEQPAPLYGWLQPIVPAQKQLIQDTYCVNSQNRIWLFELDSDPSTGVAIPSQNPTFGIGAWTPLVTDEYIWTEGVLVGDISINTLMSMLSMQGKAWMMLGELSGTCGSRMIAAIGLSAVVNDEPKHYLLPLVGLPEVVQDDLYEFYDELIATRALPVDCFDCFTTNCCEQRYRLMMSDALRDFGRRIKPQFSITWKNAACMVACVPLLSGTPLLYFACAAGCTALIDTTPTLINLNVNTDILEEDESQAAASYCLCLQWKVSNCAPNWHEDDVLPGGCP